MESGKVTRNAAQQMQQVYSEARVEVALSDTYIVLKHISVFGKHLIVLFLRGVGSTYWALA